MGLESAGDPPIMSHDPLPEVVSLGERIRVVKIPPGSAGRTGLRSHPEEAGQAELVICD
jgi:hypothetical protein